MGQTGDNRAQSDHTNSPDWYHNTILWHVPLVSDIQVFGPVNLEFSNISVYYPFRTPAPAMQDLLPQTIANEYMHVMILAVKSPNGQAHHVQQLKIPVPLERYSERLPA